MKKSMLKLTAVLALLIVVLAAAGCGGGGQGGAKRLTGLAPDEVVQTFFNAAKSGNLNDAGLYVSPSSANDPQTVIKYLTGNSGLNELKNANLLSLRKAAEQGNYAVVVATLQTAQNTTNIVIRPVGLEKVNGEWYIVDFDQIYQGAKYQILQQLLAKI